MKRPDIRMAWREKVTICMMIFGLCGIILFYIILFGRLLCPGQNSVWSEAELGGHSTSTNFWVAVAGEVYDITPFSRGDHSDVAAVPVTQTDMLQLAGSELTHYFPVPLVTGCLGFVTDASLALQAENFSAVVPNAVHYSGQQTSLTGALTSEAWYPNVFLPAMKQYRKGSLVYTKGAIAKQANDGRRVPRALSASYVIMLINVYQELGILA
jgi:chitin synthase